MTLCIRMFSYRLERTVHRLMLNRVSTPILEYLAKPTRRKRRHNIQYSIKKTIFKKQSIWLAFKAITMLKEMRMAESNSDFWDVLSPKRNRRWYKMAIYPYRIFHRLTTLMVGHVLSSVNWKDYIVLITISKLWTVILID